MLRTFLSEIYKNINKSVCDPFASPRTASSVRGASERGGIAGRGLARRQLPPAGLERQDRRALDVEEFKRGSLSMGPPTRPTGGSHTMRRLRERTSPRQARHY